MNVWCTEAGCTWGTKDPYNALMSASKGNSIQKDYLQVKWREENCIIYTWCLQMNGAVSKVNKKFISNLTRAQRTPSAAATVQFSHALLAARFSCLLRGHGVSFQDGVAAGKRFLCAPFWGFQICDYSAAWVSYTVITDLDTSKRSTQKAFSCCDAIL